MFRTWSAAQRRRALERTIRKQARHAHERGVIRRLGRTMLEMTCDGCGASLARYVWRQHAHGAELFVTWHYDDKETSE